MIASSFETSGKVTKTPPPAIGVRKDRVGDVKRVFDDQAGIAIEAAIEVEVNFRQWLWAGDGIVTIVQAHCDDIFSACVGKFRDVHDVRQIPSHELTGEYTIDPNLR